jgi:tricorn protease
VWGKRTTGDTATVPLLTGPADDRAVAFSPDGRWLAYMSDASGTNEVYIRPFPDVNAGQWQVSLEGGSAPVWAHSGRELFYVNRANEMVVADLSNGPSHVGAQKVLFSLEGYRLSTNYTWFDVSPDNQRFLMVRESPHSGRLIVVDNFFEELRAKVGT